MSEDVHKYYCPSCNRNLYGESLRQLATALNLHNERSHPADCCNWVETGLVNSGFYSGPGLDMHPAEQELRRVGARSATPEEKRAAAYQPLPEYTQPYGTTSRGEWGGAKAPILTDDDKAMLAKGLIKW